VLAELIRPRWGVGSVRLHLDIDDLALGLLLFDRLVIPTPASEAEFDRWVGQGWDPERLAHRVVQLADLVEMVPWDDQLQARWREQYDLLAELGAETEGIAYYSTPLVIADHAWSLIHREAEDAPPRPALPVIWCRSSADASVQLGIDSANQVGQDIALEFRRELEYPLTEHPEEALEVAYGLAVDPEFIAARRTMFEWELLVVGQSEDPVDALAGLRESARRYDEIVHEHAQSTVRRGVHVVIPAAATQVARLSGLPGSALAAGWSTRQALARLVPLPPRPDAGAEQGAALSMARREMSALYPE
jgi:hypothetical protein